MTCNSRILVIYAGGTFGMQASEEGLRPAAGLESRLAQVTSGLVDLPEYDVIELSPLIDSSNLLPSHWSQLYSLLGQYWHQYRGFVVIHGTDTMAYTASALSFLLGRVDKPVIVTGSQIPLGQTRSDASGNFVAALQWAAEPGLAEVCIAFGNRLLRGNRARKISSCALAAFDSPNSAWLGQVGITLESSSVFWRKAGDPRLESVTFDSNAVSMLAVYPGVSAALITHMLTIPGLKALVLQTYGAGNPPDADAKLMQALADASARGICIVNVTQCNHGGVAQGTYASGAALTRCGVISGTDLTPEAAFAKLHCLVARGVSGEQLRQMMQQDLAGELTIRS